MIAEGLLWFDDDPRRSLLEKIASAVERYSERTGWQPTLCETYPAQAEAFQAERAREAQRAAKPSARRVAAQAPAVELPPRLRVTPNPSMRPNYFLIGLAPDERPRKATSKAVTGRSAHKAPSKASGDPAPRATARATARATSKAPIRATSETSSEASSDATTVAADQRNRRPATARAARHSRANPNGFAGAH